MMAIDKQSVILARRRRALIAPSIMAEVSGETVVFNSASLQSIYIENNDSDLVYHSGKNISEVGAFAYPDDGSVCVIFDGLPPGKTYNASAHRDAVVTTGSGIRIRFQYDINGETIYDPGGYGSTGWMSKSCAVPAVAENVRVAVQRASAVSAYSISEIQLEIGDARTAFEAFHLFEVGKGVKCAVPGMNVVWAAAGTNTVSFRRFAWQEVAE